MRGFFLREDPFRKTDSLGARKVLLDMQCLDISPPGIPRNLIRRIEQPDAPAQHHFVVPHPLDDAILAFFGMGMKTGPGLLKDIRPRVVPDHHCRSKRNDQHQPWDLLDPDHPSQHVFRPLGGWGTAMLLRSGPHDDHWCPYLSSQQFFICHIISAKRRSIFRHSSCVHRDMGNTACFLP